MQKNNAYDALNTRGKTQDDIFINIHKSVKATVTIPVGTKLRPADLLVTTDGGKTFVPAYIDEYDNAKTDYANGSKAISSGHIFTALEENPTADSIDDDTKWRDDGVYVINGAAMITFEREATETEESLVCAVAVDCELLSHQMYSFNESSRVAGFPNILMK
ncbi:hypothetical protein [Arcobacter sp.]|uniref:hypothetical protein n=1 Tax=unclassified Arcobacter TaxID=2593671 RepID=UPI003AFFDF42